MYQFTKLKMDKLQTWISVGGWEFSDPGPTRNTMVRHGKQKGEPCCLIASALKFMAQYGFQSMDLDWEYSATPERGGRESDTADQVSLVKEMRKGFDVKQSEWRYLNEGLPAGSSGPPAAVGNTTTASNSGPPIPFVNNTATGNTTGSLGPADERFYERFFECWFKSNPVTP
jgi:hypothetical protein